MLVSEDAMKTAKSPRWWEIVGALLLFTLFVICSALPRKRIYRGPR